jgi:hypothetical protein
MATYIRSINTILLHVPKTAGTYASHVAMQVAPCRDLPVPGVSRRHQLPLHCRDSTNYPKTEWPPRFAMFVRWPFEWYASWFRFQTRAQWRTWEPGAWHPLNDTNACKSDTFDDFVQRMCDRYPDGFLTGLYRSYEDHPDVNFVGKCEYMDACLTQLLRVERLPTVPQAARNASRGCIEFCDSSVDAIMAVEHQAIERYYPEAPGFEAGLDEVHVPCSFTRQSSGRLEVACCATLARRA